MITSIVENTTAFIFPIHPLKFHKKCVRMRGNLSPARGNGVVMISAKANQKRTSAAVTQTTDDHITPCKQCKEYIKYCKFQPHPQSPMLN